MKTSSEFRADPEKLRPYFFQTGLIIALSLALLAFEWKTTDVRTIVLPPSITIEPEPDIISLAVKQKELPKPVNTTLLREVINTADDLPDLNVNTEIDLTDAVAAYTPPEPLPDEPEAKDYEPFVVVEKMPSFPGGDAAMMRFLTDNITYPRAAREAGISGTVYVSFVVEENGSISGIQVLRELAGGCTEEAVRVIRLMPDWEPGRQRGKAVRVRLSMPVSFKLVG